MHINRPMGFSKTTWSSESLGLSSASVDSKGDANFSRLLEERSRYKCVLTNMVVK